ncbi:helix-turn-helix domain-containing protein [Parahaliea mediterranea]|uniref:AraC-like ligand-binding domain-containing protein n=1 Tax=Parahaliea mediterranea TaxID=651086 RepID=UPI000E2E7CDE|nr:helix-turn-helix domain-containing protein [Parahaliea mediterranea]
MGSLMEVEIQGFDQFDTQVSELFFPMDCETPRDSRGGFRGAIERRQFGELGFAAVRSTPLDVYRRRSHIGRVSSTQYLVKVQVEGESLICHRGREAHLRPGDFTLCLSSEPYELHFPSDYSQVVLSVPQPLMEDCLHHPERHLGVRRDARVGANGLFSQFVTSIVSRLDDMDGVLAQRLEANVIDLLATTLTHSEESERRDRLDSGVKCEHLHRIKQFIRSHLHDERLGPGWVAQSLGISTRYLHLLFADEGVSVSRYILGMRLDASRQAFSNASYHRYSIADIAYRFGFKDPAHFSRAFKRAFGDSPARYRRALGAE